MSALYILACSTGKNPTGFSPYKGRQHTLIVKAFLAHRYACGDTLAWLSGGHGYITPDAIPSRCYDARLTAKRAAEIAANPVQRARLLALLEGHDTVVLYGSTLYRNTVVSMLSDDIAIVHLVGANRGCGDHFSALQRHLAEPGC